MVNKRVRNAVLGCNLKNDKMISVRFQGKPFNITVIQVKAMVPHSSTLACKIPWMEEPGRLQSMGSRRVGYDWATSLSLSFIGEGNGNPLQCSCLENPRDRGAWWAAVYGIPQSQTRLKRLSSSSRHIFMRLFLDIFNIFKFEFTKQVY